MSKEWHKLTKINKTYRTAICSVCGPDTKIDVRTNETTGCAVARLQRTKAYYESHKPAKHSQIKALQVKKLEMIRKVKEVPCMDCKIEWPHYVMQFDHRPGEIKLFNINSNAVHYGKQKILDEISKCDVVCCNCHSIRTWNRSHPE